MHDTLNARQREFVRLFCAGPDGVRGNGTRAYKAAGYAVKNDIAAGISAHRLLKLPHIILAIKRFHAQADAATIAQLQDWKVLATAAQKRLDVLAAGALPTVPPEELRGSPLDDGTTNRAAIGELMAKVNLAIVERAYPSKLNVLLGKVDPKDELAALLGVPPEDLPA